MDLGGITTGTRVRYSAIGRDVLCRPGDRFAADPERVGAFLGMVTANVGRVLWDDRPSPQYLHIDYINPAPRLSSLTAGTSTGAASAAPVLSSPSATRANSASSRTAGSANRADTPVRPESPSTDRRPNSVAP